MKIFKILSLPFLLFAFTQCASYRLDKKPPFTIKSATYSKFVGGRQESLGGTKITVVYTTDSNVTFDHIYYGTKKARISNTSYQGKQSISANFYNSANNVDIQMHADPAKEFGNTPTKKQEKIPFKLKENEIVIGYFIGNTKKYFKVSDLKKGKQKIMH